MHRLIAVVTAGLLLALAGLGPASAEVQDSSRELSVRIEDVTAEPDGTTRLSVVVSGLPAEETVDLAELEIAENGTPVEGLELASLEAVETGRVVPAVVVAVDVSGSTAGEPLAAATSSAATLVRSVADRGGLVGVVSFGPTTTIEVPMSADGGTAAQVLESLEAGGETALFDGVSRAARMLANHDGPRDVILFADGADSASTSELDDVRALLAETEVRLTSVLLRSEEFAIEPLQAMASVNDGQFIEVESADQLATAFAAVSGDLTNRLQVEYVAEPVLDPAGELNLVATYRSGDRIATDGSQLANPRLAAVRPPVAVDAPEPVLPMLTDETGRLVVAVATGLALVLLIFVILAAGGERRRRGVLEERLSAYQAGVGDRGRDDRVSLSDRASSVFDSIPRPKSLDSRIAAAIEHADWPLRGSEFLLITLGTAVLGLLIGGVLLGSAFFALTGLLVGLAGPWVYMQVAISRRRSAFSEQLPTILQVMAGSLRAGHAFSTALDGAVDELDEPAKTELRRAAVEARLGRPLDRALEGVAERMDSVDLRWVIGALEVQREVGGNLAEILGNVADTLRDRASVARQVKTLTAEGRLSAGFISAMPFFMFAFLALSNPDYVRPLFTEPLGMLMLGGGFVLLILGLIVLRRLVRPKY